MFRRFLEFCRPWTRQADAPVLHSRFPTRNDRRIWVRYPANAETQLLPIADPDETRLPAHVRDVSRGGINLVVFRSFVPGDLLSIDLPSADSGARNSILACVVHVNPVSEEAWALGCVFCADLSDVELATFGARREKAPASDNRSFIRYSGELRATYERVDAPGTPPRAADVANISATGIGLRINSPLEIGALLNLNLLGAAGAATRRILACVVHVTSVPGQSCVLGCNFIHELSEEDLSALLRTNHREAPAGG